MTTLYKWEAPAQALERWNPDIVCAEKDDKDAINILGQIGDSFFEEGTTAKLVSALLRKANGKDITVNINSPGGDFFEGLAIHSLLDGYSGKVTVNVLGLAASAASVIAMAGDEINIAKAGFIMIHNAWTIAMGNSGDMQEVSDVLAKFDKSMVGLYASKTGLEQKEVSKMMGAETWLSSEDAIEKGFANGLLNDTAINIAEDGEKEYNSSLRRVDVALAKAGMPRSERRALIKTLTGTPSAAVTTPTPSAGNIELGKSLADLLKNLKQQT